MFASADMSWYAEGVVRKYFNVLNRLRWCNHGSMSFRCRREELRNCLNPNEETIFAENLEGIPKIVTIRFMNLLHLI